MSAAPRTIQTTAGTRNLAAALFAVLVAIALAALLVFSQLTSAKQQAAPAAGAAQATWDHGTSSAPSAIGAGAAPATWDHGTSSAPSAIGAGAAQATWDHGTSSAPSATGASSDTGGTYLGRFAR